jgi:uncharacterized membrane protein
MFSGKAVPVRYTVGVRLALRSPRNQFVLALLISSLVSFGLYLFGALQNDSLRYGYMLWNLFLAWLPLVFAMRLTTVLRNKLWSSWEGIGWSLLWLVFLPNSFYMISDFIHLHEIERFDPVYDTALFTSFIFTGVVLGFSSLYLIHRQLVRRLGERRAVGWVGLILLLCSIGIFIGRDLHWNSWDVLTNPGGLLFDISDRLMHISEYPQMIVIVVSFFVLLSTMYGLLWGGSRLLLKTKL